MTDLKSFLVLRRLRASLKTASLEDIQVIQNNLSQIKNEKEEQLNKIIAEREEHNQKIEEVKAMMQKWGLTSSDLDERGIIRRNNDSPKRKLKPKYQITLPSGEIKTWTGRGKIPLVFRNVNLQDYLIKE